MTYRKCPCCGMEGWNGTLHENFTLYGLTLPEILETIHFARMKGYKQPEVSTINPLN